MRPGDGAGQPVLAERPADLRRDGRTARPALVADGGWLYVTLAGTVKSAAAAARFP
jgi:hypothetical protein